MFFLSYVMRFGLGKLRLPHLLAPLFIGLVFQMFPLLSPLVDVILGDVFHFLAQLGIIFLLFLIGFQLNIGRLISLSKEIVALSLLNLAFSSLLGFYILSSFGYPPLISILVATALATIAETTIAPVLDELGILDTKMASLIIGPGVLDDVAEVIIASMASVIVGAEASTESPILLVSGLLILVALAVTFHRFAIPVIARFDKEPGEVHLFLLTVSAALMFTAWSPARCRYCWYDLPETQKSV